MKGYGWELDGINVIRHKCTLNSLFIYQKLACYQAIKICKNSIHIVTQSINICTYMIIIH